MVIKKQCRTAISLTFIVIFLIGSVGILALVNNVQAAPPYQLKWAVNVGVATHIGALSAKLVPGGNEQDVVLTGVPQTDAGYTNGSVIALNGTNGAVLWRTYPGNILDHAPFEIADLNNDGKQEIVVADMPSTIALYGVNGSIYWKSAAPSYDVSPVIADVDGDGHKEVFVASGRGPYQGYDYISELTYNGQIITQSNTSWHPCYGGLAIVDPKNDGHFILLMGDRSITYNPSEDPYQNGGWGIRALDARTLTPLWNDSRVLSSSQIPMLADVDGDGVLDVVISAQSRGLAVYNVTSGQVLDTGGIYRYSQNLNMSSHSQPTIYIDQNGIPQYITCQNSNATIWNLRDWTLTAKLNWSVGEPPKMGRVTADGQMDMIVIEGNNVHILNENFQEVGNITGMNQPNEMTLVSDVDGDGYNEIVFTTRSGWVYCYGTPAKAISPAPRTNVDYYSEYRVGVAEYVDPPGPAVPQITALSPNNGMMNVSTSVSSLSFKLLDYWGYALNYTVTTSPNIGTATGTNVYNGVHSVSVSGLHNSTTYSWQVTATDGVHPNATTFTFTTAGSNTASNNPPNVTSPVPSNNATGVLLTQSSLFFNLNDADNDLMNYSVVTTPNIGVGSGTNVANGQYNVSISGLQNLTTYQWQVNATDGKNNTLVTFNFTTSGGGLPPPQIPWWDPAWQYRLNVTIDHTKVTANLINFPVLIDLTSTSFATHAQANGNDIAFIDSSVHKLNHEIEAYDPASGHLVSWVLIPNLSNTTNTVLSVYYGNPSSQNQQNPNGVWDPNFLLVQHLNATSSTQRDSTSNHNDGTTTGVVTTGTPGKIVGSISFTGGYITLPTVLSSQTQFTFSAWIYAQSGARYFISKWANNQGAFLQVVGNNYVQFYVNSIMVQKPVTLNQWHYVVGTFSGSVMNLWVDGGSPSSVSASGLAWPSQPTYVGDRYDHTRQFIGLIDEVRVSSIARSNDWINTEYIDQNAPSTFYTISIEEVRTSNSPIVSNPSPVDGATGVNFNPTLSVQINATQGQPMTIYFLSNATGVWQPLGSYANLSNGTVTQTTTTMNNNATTYFWMVQVTDGTYWTNKTFQFTTRLPPSSSWYNSSWQYRMNITISHAQFNSTLTNYPILVDLTRSSLIGNAQTSGQDFVFTDINNQKLDHQIEYYNSTTGHLTAWVRVPILSSSTDTTIFMYYGNSTVPDQQNSTGVWDSNYLLVLHLNDGPTQCNDSTINGNNGILSGNVTQAQGEIGNGYSFTGGNVSLPKILSGSQTQFTFSAWINAQSGARYFISEWTNNQGAFLQVVGNSVLQFYVNGMMVQKPVTLDQWHYVVGTYNGTALSLWVDGGTPVSVAASAPSWPNQNMTLGDRSDNQRTFYGLIDEVRVSSIARSNDWINTEYLNQNNPSVFYIIGPPESFSP
jgi:hypothetical protein